MEKFRNFRRLIAQTARLTAAIRQYERATDGTMPRHDAGRDPAFGMTAVARNETRRQPDAIGGADPIEPRRRPRLDDIVTEAEQEMLKDES